MRSFERNGDNVCSVHHSLSVGSVLLVGEFSRLTFTVFYFSVSNVAILLSPSLYVLDNSHSSSSKYERITYCACVIAHFANHSNCFQDVRGISTVHMESVVYGDCCQIPRLVYRFTISDNEHPIFKVVRWMRQISSITLE